MKKLTSKAFVYLALAVIGLAFVAYSARIKNYFLLAISAIFAFVSADNIFCNLKSNKNQ